MGASSFDIKADGNGKLSKRDAERLGFPIFAMDWKDPRTNEHTQGFREKGFLPEAFVNMLALLGWNDGTEQEIFSLDELVQRFSMDHVHKSGAKFNYEKALWFNHEWIKKLPVSGFLLPVKERMKKKGIEINDDEKLKKVLELVKDRCTLLTDFCTTDFFLF
jgi:glutamyl-tRNA synthetase